GLHPAYRTRRSVMGTAPAPAVTGSPSLPAGRPYAYCWHEVFEEQARLTPEAAAVMWAHGTITYRELDQRANALAHRLRRLGAQPGVVVAVVMERSVEFALAILAIAKSGSAFLLADVTCPRQRLRAMLVEAEVRLVISDGSLPTSTFPAQVIGTGEPAARPDPPMTGATPGDTAYIVFTSGTTGAPKAIAISHEATVNLGLAQRQIFTLGPGDRLLQFLSPNFDGCIADLTLALLSGATLALAPTDRLTVGPPLVRLLGSAKITAVILTPSVWMALPVQQLPHLRTAAAAGERLHATWAQQWAAPGRRLFNLYGPAETAVLATWHECTLSEEPPPIGRPIANKEAYLIDNDLRRVEPGQEGELCIGGTGIGRYLNQPDLMQERFIRDPYTSTRPAGLLYRTGDICRQRPDGTLDYVGRHDRQVKIRGQRLELDEVERVLETAPGVAASRVQEQDGRLHALITAAGQPPDEEAIRSHLATRLHTAMVPATLTTVSELPRTQNGKVSQRATAAATNGHRDHPAPEASAAPMVMPPRCNSPAAPGASTVPSASGTPRKQHSRLTWQITQHFAKALGLPLRQVQTDSDFFTHGGDSLKLASLLQALETLTGAPVDITELITSPTPERIATHLLTEETSS
ncbi:non-ribosomal peptide synthetase, partial [Streptomyces kanamyceticus]|uniref:non-ribosomal peptide synthetase n=1 Tax=Streptomyces kanamyceticus TaxID=1967 RepID=UPI0012FED99F